MKLKNISIAAFSVILLALFLPVFCCVIFIGNDMPYNELYKITTLYGNEILLLFALLSTILFFAVYALFCKIPLNRRSGVGVVLFSLVVSVVFYLINCEIAKCIAFYGGWDCGMVANSARWVFEGKDIGYGDYYTIYCNNIPIVWLLYKLYAFASTMSGYPYNPDFIWIQFQCAVLSAALFFSVMTVFLVSKKIAVVMMTLLLNGLFLGVSPWKIIPYTDVVTIVFPVWIMFVYALILHTKSKWKYVLYFLLYFTGILGGIFKATCYIVLIAVVLIDFLWIFCDRASLLKKAKQVLLCLAVLTCAYMLAACCRAGMYKALDYEYNKNVAVSWSTYLYMGLNEETTGACSEDGITLARSYAELPHYVRNMAERKYIKERVTEKGFVGLIVFWLRKQTMNYNDGTFGWFQEGFFNAWSYADITQSRLKWPLRAIYWEGEKYYICFNTFSQYIWFFVLLGIIALTLQLLFGACSRIKKPVSCGAEDTAGIRMGLVGVVTFIGMFLFVMLFEGRARYLYNNTALFSVLASMGCGLSQKILDKSKTYFKRRHFRQS